jgi:hypothetical protein
MQGFGKHGPVFLRDKTKNLVMLRLPALEVNHIYVAVFEATT